MGSGTGSQLGDSTATTTTMMMMKTTAAAVAVARGDVSRLAVGWWLCFAGYSGGGGGGTRDWPVYRHLVGFCLALRENANNLICNRAPF